MSFPHRKGYATADEAMHSKAFLSNPGATLTENCPCGIIHVDLPRPKPVPRLVAATASDIPAAVRALVLARDCWSCVCCGKSILGRRYSLGHRRRASQGGRPVPSNLLTFLGWGGEACHGRIDLYEDPEDEVKGYRVRSRQDPALIPVKVFSEHGWFEAWPTDDGRWSTEPPAVAA